jgi:hypothetical protein
MIHYWALTMAIPRFSLLFLVDLQCRQRTGSPQPWQTSSMSGFGWARRKVRTCSSHEDVVSCRDRGRAAGASLSIMQNLCLDFISNNSGMPARIVPTNYRTSEGQKRTEERWIREKGGGRRKNDNCIPFTVLICRRWYTTMVYYLACHFLPDRSGQTVSAGQPPDFRIPTLSGDWGIMV